MKRNLSRSQRNMVKTSKNKKVNKGPSATWWPNFENVKKQKMDFFIILTTPENMKTVCATLKSQCSIVIFAKIAKNWPNFSFLAIILVPDQKNPNFLDFLDPYTCPDLGQEESQKVWSTLVITLVGTLVPTVLSAFYLCSKYPHFNRTYLVRVQFDLTVAVCDRRFLCFFGLHKKFNNFRLLSL